MARNDISAHRLGNSHLLLFNPRRGGRDMLFGSRAHADPAHSAIAISLQVMSPTLRPFEKDQGHHTRIRLHKARPIRFGSDVRCSDEYITRRSQSSVRHNRTVSFARVNVPCAFCPAASSAPLAQDGPSLPRRAVVPGGTRSEPVEVPSPCGRDPPQPV